MNYKQEFIKFMVRSGVLTFGDFTAKSGRKTPYFINTGNYKTGAQAARLGEFYAQCLTENIPGKVDALFGPAYKGIPLSVATAIALANNHGRDVNYCFNRKEAKDHGEGGVMVGYKLQDGDKVVIIEDVTTAGTSVEETMPILKAAGSVQVLGLVVSVDRMERGKTEQSALQEISARYGIRTAAIVTMAEVVEHLYNRPYKGKIIIDDSIKAAIDAYYEQYGCAK